MTKETTHLLSSVSAARLIHHSLCWPLLHHSPSASDLFQAHPHTHARANSKVSHVTSVNVRVTRSSSVTKLGTKTRNVILHHAFRPPQSRAGVISAADPSASTSKTNETWLIIIEGGEEQTVPITALVFEGARVIYTALDILQNGAVEKPAQTNTFIFWKMGGAGTMLL